MVKYEKLGLFCDACGLVGHEYKECGNGIFEAKQLKFIDWLHAFPFGRGRSASGIGGVRGGNTAFGTPAREEEQPGRGRGRMGAGMGCGRGSFVDWRNHPERQDLGQEGELNDVASSPIKGDDVIMSDAEKAARKRLAFEDMDNTNQVLENTGDVGITLRVLDIAIPGANYEAGPAQGLDELDLHAPQLGLQGKKTPTRILLGLL
ncbi:hypothetical protein QYE76_003218 [Lolium multiflorum]|uniref:Zinc knuckle CX2CX4HX4C domain-containing protein n=1 Tax=Lolium multiflorum TaxID=4521 RepID=A0AAD8RNA1_LOLMU|nr:hypothetical protein QYE76_003218 [Lolium multiflorum]